MKTSVVLFALLGFSYGRQGFGPGEQDWGYVTVRPGAHKFWWLYETIADVKNITERPLVIWLQGGPGGSSTGFGNLAEIGPLDPDLKPREHTWTKDVNVLFIDNPVGTGYSYVDDDSKLTTTNNQIALDLIACVSGFFAVRPEFRNAPLYVASESYGGKMAVEFALEVDKSVKSGKSNINLLGISLIDSWISPIDSVLNWAPFLYNIGGVDQDGYNAIDKGAQRTKVALQNGNFLQATKEWRYTEEIIMRVSNNIDFYNILTKIRTQHLNRIQNTKQDVPRPGVDYELSEEEKIELLMNGAIKEALKLNVTWGKLRNRVFEALEEDFMKPVTQIVEELLNKTKIKVQVVTGQLDLIVETSGTVKWVERLNWKESINWQNSPRDALSVNGINEGYQKKSQQFSMYWVNRAGHMVPSDNPITMRAILQDLIDK